MRTILSAFLLSILFLSCEKEKDPEHTIKFKVDGNWLSYPKAGYILQETADPSVYHLVVAAFNADRTALFTVDLDVSTEVEPRTYDSQTDALEFVYVTGVDQDQTFYEMFPVQGQPDPHFILTITSVTETEIRGTFTGNYLADASGNMIQLSEGEFVAKKEE